MIVSHLSVIWHSIQWSLTRVLEDFCTKGKFSCRMGIRKRLVLKDKNFYCKIHYYTKGKKPNDSFRWEKKTQKTRQLNKSNLFDRKKSDLRWNISSDDLQGLVALVKVPGEVLPNQKNSITLSFFKQGNLTVLAVFYSSALIHIHTPPFA